uniref:Venom nerve growth factor n=1 Tax=Macrovipera lebetinus TaxID=3148341 RepID=NGFV_MACLB|nr:RecName: Full=Venom nerve growth factor; Short=v-NGF; Short=vNGF; Contains: RecName: Full=Truncated venom nerve growth factor; Flags: Precursor [Macrovipera lebetina]AAV64846.1 nerve growth factor [Macrovipera lebetina]
MSMLCYTLIIAFLIGIWAAPKSEDNVSLGSPATPDLSDTSCAKTHEALKTSRNTDQHYPAPKKAEDQEFGSAANIIVDPKLFQKRRFQSPRVLFSTQPPPLSRDEQSVEFLDNADSLNRNIRAKRATHPVHNRGEFSVCDSVSVWVANKTTATDIRGNVVTVMVDVKLNNNVYRQYFFETKCKNPSPVSSGCRGIDAKHWNSYCTTTDTFVRALTMEGNQASWRFIRIDTACVCVISRKNDNFG